MNDFIFHNPDKVYLGKNQISHLSDELPKFGKKVLLVYGGGSIKRNGLYDQIVGLLKEHELELFVARKESQPPLSQKMGTQPLIW